MADHPLVRLLADACKRKPDDSTGWETVDAWLAEHDDVVSLLVQLATDSELLREKELAGGELPIIATYLLERYQDPRAIEPLLGVLCSMPPALPALLQWNAIWEVLHAMADHVPGPAIALYRRSDDPRHRAILATLLGDIQAGQSGQAGQSEVNEVYEILAAELPQRPCLMATYLGTHGDPRALPLLLETFDQMAWNSHGEFGEWFAGQPMLDLLDAITALSGELSPEQWQAYERAWKLRAPRQPPPSIVPPPRREPSPGHISRLPAATITACTSIEFNQKALVWYGTLRNTAAKLRTTPATIHHWACTMASVV